MADALYEEIGGTPSGLKLASKVAVERGVRDQGRNDRSQEPKLYVLRRKRPCSRPAVSRGSSTTAERYPKETCPSRTGVRRVTAPMCFSVLERDPVKVAYGYEARQETLELMKQQVDMFTEEPDGSLRPRQDVRRVMLKLLQEKRRKQVSLIHRLEVNFIERPFQARIRAELLYHLLQSRRGPGGKSNTLGRRMPLSPS